MSISRPHILPWIAFAVSSAVLTFLLLAVAAFLISELPRPTQGESVSLSHPACVSCALAAAVLLPWLASLPVLPHPRCRLYFLLCLACAAAAWYFFGLDDLFGKAYRRGL